MSKQELQCYFNESGYVLDYVISDRKKPYDNDLLYRNYTIDKVTALLNLGFTPLDESIDIPLSISFLHLFSSYFIMKVSRSDELEFTRKAPPLDNDDIHELLDSGTFVSAFIDKSWLKKIWKELSKTLEIESKSFDTIANYLLSKDHRIKTFGKIFFHLVESKDEEYPFAFLATYSTTNKGSAHTPLKNALVEFKGKTSALLHLLSTVNKAAENSLFIREIMESGELFSPLRLTSKEAYVFLQEIPLYEQCGILCRIPNWWKNKSSSVSLKVTIGEKKQAKVGLDELIDFDSSIILGDEELSKSDIEFILSQSSGLSFIKGKWVEVDHEKLKAVLEAYNKLDQLQLTMAEALKLQMNSITVSDLVDVDDVVEVSNGQWLSSVRSSMIKPSLSKQLFFSDDFKAVLRDYQRRGVSWLQLMKSMNFGCLLADDMGLGKTVQVLALLEQLRLKGDFKGLLIVPASLLGNWEKEIIKFTPKLSFSIIHSDNKDMTINDSSLFITTYGMALRLKEIHDYVWDILILDEAQAIKNPATKQTKTIKKIKCKYKLALTGTPIENRLSDLWSIFDFLNPGLLGTAKEFGEFSKRLRLKQDFSALKKGIEPFILRRLKTDKSIIADLPDKVEAKRYASMSKKQVVLYNDFVENLKEKLTDSFGIQRKGIVLSSIMKFKQLCNHPDQYLGSGDFECSQSGKFDLLLDICETIRDNREKVLVFTQFREMTDHLASFLESIWGRKGFVLHGGTSVKKRTEMVEQFNSDDYIPFMVLSLKAGGTGLNLTSANHVIHFDRWWNPAVENQATDRAFRIGQTKNVMVHKFITAGTIEDKIDMMIEEKKQLVEDIIMDGEDWITTMNDEQLINLFSLESDGE